MFIMFNGKINYKWPFSICLFTGGYPEQSVNPQIAIRVDRIRAKWGPQNPEATAIRRQHVADSTSRPSGTDLRNAGKSAWSKAAPLGGRVAEWTSDCQNSPADPIDPIRPGRQKTSIHDDPTRIRLEHVQKIEVMVAIIGEYTGQFSGMPKGKDVKI